MTEHRLCDCTEGATGVITRMDGQSQIIARLLEMGLLPGEQVRIVRAGAPLILQVGDTRLCVRPDQLDGIRVSPIDPTLLGGLESVYAGDSAYAGAARRV